MLEEDHQIFKIPVKEENGSSSSEIKSEKGKCRPYYPVFSNSLGPPLLSSGGHFLFPFSLIDLAKPLFYPRLAGWSGRCIIYSSAKYIP